ncbi:hypothetical protein GCM10011487_64450 [Steroidobacter agaridevorans]|uniref:Secreted protein n=1 Tax=Steroidobacter agaridevorans TaxID=2695856 RepID=A0A829YMA8_9GAMM|nr:hypothetical protein [Steroidobacter agaridevorans]GFE84445.1 hypothetical protein GCM10011487_64450 [Steroidobacter agaridevorans]GFE90843.1 hypothetical protein GCM10011488_57970 [Steroidobacter agaridevorans]
MLRRFMLGSLLALVGAGPMPASAEANVRCTLKFSMQGWSAFYKTADGRGTIDCDNGQSLKVKLSAKGGGLTIGKSSIENGQGRFSAVGSTAQLLGTYVAAEAHAGVIKSAGAQVMTKGEVSLALSGTGRGVDLGVVFGAMTISL